MPNEVSRLAKYVDTMKSNPAVAQKETQQPVDGIAALASQIYNAAPKPKAPVSYPEGTALMKAVASTPERASSNLSKVFSEAAQNPKLAPYVAQLVELAKRYKAEHPEATEEELGKAVFSSAPPEIKDAILNIAYEHVGGEQGYAKGGDIKELLKQTSKAVSEGKASRIKDRPPIEGIETTPQARTAATGIETTPQATSAARAASDVPNVPGGSPYVLTRGEYNRLPLKEKILDKLDNLTQFPALVNKFLQWGLTGEQAYHLYDTYNKVQAGELKPDVFYKEATKFGVNLASTGLSSIPHPVPQIAGFGLGLAGDKLVDNYDDIKENWEAYKHDFKDMLGLNKPEFIGPPVPPQGIAKTPEATNKAKVPSSGIAKNVATNEFVGPPAPQRQSVDGIAKVAQQQYGPSDAAPQQPQYDESMPDQAIQKIMSLYSVPQYSSQIMDMLKQGKRDAMLQTALSMMAGTGAGLAQRNWNEGMSQANLLAGNAFTSGMDRANQAEHEWMKAQIANEMAPVDLRNKSVDAYLAMQGKAADREAMLNHYRLTGEYGLLGDQIRAQGQLAAAQARNDPAAMDYKQQKMYIDTLKERRMVVKGQIDSKIKANGGVVDEKDPELIRLNQEYVSLGRALDSMLQDSGLAYGEGMGEAPPTTVVPTLGTDGTIK